MFDTVFSEYKKTIHARFHRNIAIEWILRVLPILSLTLIPFVYMEFSTWLAVVPLSVCLLSSLISYIYFNRIRFKLSQEHTNDEVIALTKMLQDKNFNLYSTAGIDELTKFYGNKQHKKLMSFTWHFLIPAIIVTVLLSLADPLRSSDITQMFYMTSTTFFTLTFILGCWLGLVLFFSNVIASKVQHKHFCDILSYMRTQCAEGF